MKICIEAHTLLCHHFLKYQKKFNTVIDSSQLRIKNFYCEFNKILIEFLHKSTQDDIYQAVENLGEALTGYMNLSFSEFPNLKMIFEEMISETLHAVKSWNCLNHFEGYHNKGSDLAKDFYKNSAWISPQNSLNRKADLIINCDHPDIRPCNISVGYFPHPMVYRSNYFDKYSGKKLKNVIIVRFGYDRDFWLYLAYPFLFMHEYVSHLFTSECAGKSINQLFNDGWLLFAIDEYLRKNGWGKLTREQINAFIDHFHGKKIDRVAARGYRIASNFCSFMHDFDHFMALTWQLAGFDPKSNEDEQLPTRFINKIESYLDYNPQGLRKELDKTKDLRQLYSDIS